MLNKNKAVVLVSGGLDSAVLLYKLHRDGLDPIALSVNYNQRHLKELDYAERLCANLGVKHHIADLSEVGFCLKGGSQTDPAVAVPHGHYADPSMKLTVVPNRNMIMLSLATGLAISTERGIVAYAAHAGDHPIYPDCRPDFINALQSAMEFAWYEPIQLLAPFSSSTKAQIVSLGESLEVPFADTWSCYEGGLVHCGTCGTCMERREAFYIADTKDPTEYRK